MGGEWFGEVGLVCPESCGREGEGGSCNRQWPHDCGGGDLIVRFKEGNAPWVYFLVGSCEGLTCSSTPEFRGSSSRELQVLPKCPSGLSK